MKLEILAFVRRRWALLLVLCLALALRTFIFLNITPVLHTDSVTYFFLEGNEPVRTAGYYLFMEAIQFFNDLLSLTPQYLRLIMFFQLFLLGTTNTFLIYTLARRISRQEGFALAMGILYNLDFLVIGFEFVILTETLTVTLLCLTLLFYWKIFEGVKSAPRWAGIFSLGLLLTRPTYTWLFALLIGVTLIIQPRQRIKGSIRQTYAKPLVIFLLINLVGILAWSWRNKRKYDYFGISTIVPYQLSYYTRHFHQKYKPGNDDQLNKFALILRQVNGWPYDFHRRLREEQNLSEAEISRILMKLNLKLIKDNFGDYVRLVPQSAADYYNYSWYWLRQWQRDFLGKSRLIAAPIRFIRILYARAFQNSYSLVFLVAVIPALFIITLRRGDEAAHLACLFEGTIHYNFLVSIILTSAGVNNSRFRVPVEPLIMLVFYAAVLRLTLEPLKHLRRLRSQKEAPPKG